MAKKKVAKRRPAEGEVSFEQALAELEQIVAELEAGQLGLGDSLERYERGIARLKQCHGQLAAATRRIELLSGVDASGKAISRPFDDDAGESLEEKGAARAKRRTGGGALGGRDMDAGGRLF